MTATKQADNDRNNKGQFIEGNKPKTSFADRPQHRHNGAWKKEDTARYKLEQMMSMNREELKELYEDPEAPLFERKLAQAINDGDWKTIREIIHEVYGTPKQSLDMTSGGAPLPPPVVRIIDERKHSRD